MDVATRRALKIAVIGNGLMGRERVQAILQLQQKKFPCCCIGIYDPYSAQIETYAKTHALKIFSTVNEILDAEPDWVIVCTPHDVALHHTQFFLQHGVKVLIEKPLGRSVAEAALLVNSQQFSDQLWVGFNYRFYPGIQSAFDDLQKKFFGKLISINMTLGHGGKPGDENTWKLDKTRSGGGSLLDPGIHLLDLVHSFTNQPIHCKSCVTWQGFWNTGIEEEVHVILQSEQTIFNLNVSNVRWRNTFRIEIHGTENYGVIAGRDRNYGVQTYHRGPRWGWQQAETQAASEKLIVTSDGESSFEKELAELFFPSSAETKLSKPCSASSAFQTMQLWEKCKSKIMEN